MRLSRIISILLHPIFMPIIAVYLSLILIPGLGFAITNYLDFVYLVLILSTIIMPILSLFLLIKIKLVSSLEITNNKERPTPLLIAGIWIPEVIRFSALGVAFFMFLAIIMHIKVNDPLYKSIPAGIFLALTVLIALFVEN